MAKLKIEHFIVGPIMTNCYFAINEETNEALVIDPGAAGQALCEKLEEEHITPVAVLLTHGHFDHADNAEMVADHFGIKIYVHEAERETMANPMINLSGTMGRTPAAYRGDVWVKDNETLELAGFKIKVLFTPGHTPGGCCFYLEDEKAVFVGDTLFNDSVGRTDFPGGSEATLLRSIKNKLMTLDDSVSVFPGHNETTTIGAERMYNPFITMRI
ncbi:MAG: MBL fold metallo-hydrolase [Lachnospiraceae bacterium]|nr:MBL fold metallo-hydrolase [Lachnospiraceae bacterium]